MFTIKNILIKYPPKLSKISSTPKLDVEVILSFVIKKPKEFLYTHPEYKLTKSQNEKFNSTIKRRLKNEPIAYITGEKEFYGLNFIVNKNTLIPRPDTEIMVDEVINEITNSKNQTFSKGGNENSSLSQKKVTESVPPPAEGVRGRVTTPLFSPLRRSLLIRDCGANANHQITLIDIGTGSGCIPISIIKNLPKDITKNIQTYAIDISQKALTLAKKNAKLHGVEKEIKFIKNDLLKNSPLSQREVGGILCGGSASIMEAEPPRHLIITANLPYISTSAYKKLSPDIKKYEPKNALVAGIDGLKYYKKLFRQINSVSNWKLSLPITLLIEIDFKTMCPKSKLKEAIKKYFPDSKIEIKKDLSGLERLVIIKKELNSL